MPVAISADKPDQEMQNNDESLEAGEVRETKDLKP
jgi:hypothetical protein